MSEKYDSTNDTLDHIDRVKYYMLICSNKLEVRAKQHDQSKLESPEKEIFDEMTPLLKDSTYGSDEYKGFLAQMKPALDHHYHHNSHHPEHYKDGLNGMNLFDILEMLCDWQASGERHASGSMERSLKVNKERFAISDQLQSILQNTARDMGLIHD